MKEHKCLYLKFKEVVNFETDNFEEIYICLTCQKEYAKYGQVAECNYCGKEYLFKNGYTWKGKEKDDIDYACSEDCLEYIKEGGD